MGGPIDVNLPLCPTSELPRILCSHCDAFTLLPVERRYIAGEYGSNDVPDPPPLRLEPVSVDHHGGRWRIPEPRIIECDHGRPEGMPLCPRCLTDLGDLLADVPPLVAELEVAHSRQVEFLDQGLGRGKPDEAGLPFNDRASGVLARLTAVLDGPPVAAALRALTDWSATVRRPDLEAFAGRFSAAVVAAHQVIQRPPTLTYYGDCPKCSKPIRQERITEADGPSARVRCTSCNAYAETLARHQAAQLDRAEDRELTITELLRVLNAAGEPVTRSEITNLIYRGGELGPLPRRLDNRPRWEGGRLVGSQVYVYRVGTVRTHLLAHRAARSRR